jgi:hypothetical protein
MRSARLRSLRELLPASALLALVALQGCGGSATNYPVSGKITLNDEPLTAETTVVLFKPDKAKGNTSPLEPLGTVSADGSYTLLTDGKKGAPPGWYRVVVTAHDSQMDLSKARRKRPVPHSLVPARYGSAASTDLVIEVVESPGPGAYDLKLKK